MTNEQIYEEATKWAEVSANVIYLDSNGKEKTEKDLLIQLFISGYSCGYALGGSNAWDRVSEIVKDSK